MKSKFDEAIEKAVSAKLSKMPPQPVYDPRHDSRWIILKSLLELNKQAMREAQNAYLMAEQAYKTSSNAWSAIRVNLDFLEDELGIEHEDDQEEGSKNE